MANLIFEAVQKFFAREQWETIQLEDETVLSMSYQGATHGWTCVAQVLEGDDVFLFYSSYPENAPEEHYAEVSQFLSFLNYRLYVGNFELDYEDGEVRFRTFLNFGDVFEDDFKSAEFIYQLIHNTIYENVRAMDYYFDALQEVIAGKPALEALIEVEDLDLEDDEYEDDAEYEEDEE